jgi:hypothetical protein
MSLRILIRKARWPEEALSNPLRGFSVVLCDIRVRQTCPMLGRFQSVAAPVSPSTHRRLNAQAAMSLNLNLIVAHHRLH